jgi:indole-3-glycerol phosphate synthase
LPEGILQQIVQSKREEVSRILPQREDLEGAAARAPDAKDLESALRSERQVAVMAEVKRRSPGAGPIRPELDPAILAEAYEVAGAAAVSVLTDGPYFGGSLSDLERVKASVDLPVFRKDFILDEIQILEARGAGADGTLLIASVLDPERLRDLLDAGRSLGLSMLVEVHDRAELDTALAVGATFVGINNRDLRTFRTDLAVTMELLAELPHEITVVSESGIRSATEVERLGAAGVHAVLVGESLLRAPDPGAATGELVGCPRVPRTHA